MHAHVRKNSFSLNIRCADVCPLTLFDMRTTTMASNVWGVLRRCMRGNEELILRYAKLSENAYAPMKGSTYAAGYDLRSAYKYIIPAHGKELIKTDLQIEVPPGT
ncbi:deoxyuridine 5'-triphosphate nucleotidohydrolase, partial [Pseudomyrmex gracilis]|uniref:deoxyuridine 5'-triphosphate nucleotidohydrolase n=1 Tax=Pseudomyrmex gracilis TaxID=219809 RepID=UPI000994AAAC